MGLELVLIAILIEGATGGLISSTVAGAATSGAEHGWRAARQSASSRYATRAAKLSQTSGGRMRLAAEARAGRVGKTLGLATWRMGTAAAVIARDAAKAGARGAAAGAATGSMKAIGRAGRGWRAAGSKAARAWQRLGQAITSARGIPRTADQEPPVSADEKTAANETNSEQEQGMTDGQKLHQDGSTTVGAVPHCGDCGGACSDGCTCDACKPGIGMARNATDPSVPHTTPQENPATGTPQKENAMNDLSAENTGAAAYVAGWDNIGLGLENHHAAFTAMAESLTTFVEANAAHDPGSGAEVAAKAHHIHEAIAAFGEAVGAHTQTLHETHDMAIEAASAGGTQSQMEYVGQS